jgi:hypothetical protein
VRGVVRRSTHGCIAVSREKENKMDANRFDALARVVGSSADRRGLLKAAAGSALGLVGLSALANGVMAADVVAEAKNCHKDKNCKGDDVCDKKKNKCVECNNNKDCKNNQKCKKNKCKNK